MALWAGQDDEVVKVWRRYQSICRFPHGHRRRGAGPAQPEAVANLAHPLAAGTQPAPAATTIVSAISKRSPMPARTARRSAKRRSVAEQASVAHLQTLSYVYLRLGKSWDQLLVDTQILDREPQTKTALASLMATLTRNRIDSRSARRIASN